MSEKIQLPDYLPSRYSSWLHLYVEVARKFKEQGIEITEETTVRLDEMYTETESRMVFSQEWPLILIKARALDFILFHLPDYTQSCRIRGFLCDKQFADRELNNATCDLTALAYILIPLQ